MNIFDKTKALVAKEKHYTFLILENLKIIEAQKLYCDLGYPSLYQYSISALGLTEAQSYAFMAVARKLFALFRSSM